VRFFWSRVECEAAVGSNVRSVPLSPARESHVLNRLFLGTKHLMLNLARPEVGAESHEGITGNQDVRQHVRPSRDVQRVH